MAAPTHSDSKKTKEISRNHKIYVSDSGMLTITGGKWTTYRQMAEEAVNKVAALIGLEPRVCVTRKMGKDKNWETEQVKNFISLAKNYILA